LLQQQRERFNENFLRLCWQQILEAVHTIHEERIVHADLKPANFVVVQGCLKLIDFGLAKAIQSGTTNIVRESQVSPSIFFFNFQFSAHPIFVSSTQQVGTVNYISPEALTDVNGGHSQQQMMKVRGFFFCFCLSHRLSILSFVFFGF
jgi:serine/threonine-protein kinase TTK/MPS1